MMFDYDDIKKVLALFDKEDIPYILNNGILENGEFINSSDSDNKKIKVKSMHKEEKNDRNRKQ